VRRIDADLEGLQPVAVPVAFERERVLRRRDEAVEVRECRRLARAEIREEDAAFLYQRIRARTDVLVHATSGRLGRCLQALAGDIEEPAVKRAAQPAVLQPAVGEIGTAVRAMAIEQTVAVLVLEHHKVLPEQAHRLHRPLGVELIDECRGLPVIAQQLARRRSGADARHQFVLLGADHVVALRRPSIASSA
jgi:hypothetical protein